MPLLSPMLWLAKDLNLHLFKTMSAKSSIRARDFHVLIRKPKFLKATLLAPLSSLQGMESGLELVSEGVIKRTKYRMCKNIANE